MTRLVSELDGYDLAYWAGRALGNEVQSSPMGRCYMRDQTSIVQLWEPHQDWAQCGPLLDDLIADGYGIHYNNHSGTGNSVMCSNTDRECIPFNGDWDRPSIDACGDTVMIAICRAFVMRKYGNEVPDEVAP